MLTFSEIIVYDPILLLAIICGIMCFIGSIYIYLFVTDKHTNDKVIIIILFIFGLIYVGFSGMSIINSNIISTTITPCSISGNLVADISESIYFAIPEHMIKLHINETKNIIVYQMYPSNILKIVNVTGSVCPPNISGC